jgi:hypothetical protein
MNLIVEMPDRKFFDEMLEDCRQEVKSVGPPKTFLKVLGDVTQTLERYLRSFTGKGLLLIDNDEDLKEVFLYLDKRLEAVQRVLARNGLNLTILFNIRFLEDWSSFYPVEPDNIDDKIKEEWNWNTIQQQVMELFHNELRETFYEIIGIRFCPVEITGWIRSFTSDTDNVEWWERNIKCLSYSSDS